MAFDWESHILAHIVIILVFNNVIKQLIYGITNNPWESKPVRYFP